MQILKLRNLSGGLDVRELRSLVVVTVSFFHVAWINKPEWRSYAIQNVTKRTRTSLLLKNAAQMGKHWWGLSVGVLTRAFCVPFCFWYIDSCSVKLRVPRSYFELVFEKNGWNRGQSPMTEDQDLRHQPSVLRWQTIFFLSFFWIGKHPQCNVLGFKWFLSVAHMSSILDRKPMAHVCQIQCSCGERPGMKKDESFHNLRSAPRMFRLISSAVDNRSFWAVLLLRKSPFRFQQDHQSVWVSVFVSARGSTWTLMELLARNMQLAIDTKKLQLTMLIQHKSRPENADLPWRCGLRGSTQGARFTRPHSVKGGFKGERERKTAVGSRWHLTCPGYPFSRSWTCWVQLNWVLAKTNELLGFYFLLCTSFTLAGAACRCLRRTVFDLHFGSWPVFHKDVSWRQNRKPLHLDTFGIFSKLWTSDLDREPPKCCVVRCGKISHAFTFGAQGLQGWGSEPRSSIIFNLSMRVLHLTGGFSRPFHCCNYVVSTPCSAMDGCIWDKYCEMRLSHSNEFSCRRVPGTCSQFSYFSSVSIPDKLALFFFRPGQICTGCFACRKLQRNGRKSAIAVWWNSALVSIWARYERPTRNH